MEKTNVSKQIREKLDQLEFGELRKLIDSCLRMDREKISHENLMLFTVNANLLIEYLSILETKILPLPVFKARGMNQLCIKLRKAENMLDSESKELREKIKLIQKLKQYSNVSIREKEIELKIKQNKVAQIKREVEECKEKIAQVS